MTVILFSMSKNRGFSLIEVLVVITLISIVSSFAVASYRNSQKNGRDSRRRGDLVALQQAFEQYYIDNELYNATCSNMATGYIQGSFPVDPINSGTNIYSGGCSPTSYCICALLEITGKGNSLDASCDFTGAGTRNYFCVQNQQ